MQCLQIALALNKEARVCSGLLPSMMGICHVAIQFPLYEYIKGRMATRGEKENDRLTPLELVGASMVSKMVASTATYPHEVVRSHMHVAGTGPFHGMVEVCKDVSPAGSCSNTPPPPPRGGLGQGLVPFGGLSWMA